MSEYDYQRGFESGWSNAIAFLGETTVDYVGFGGGTRTVETEMSLGRGVWRTPEYGLRRAVWDAAFGYVSGFRKRDIVYYVVTRSFSAWLGDRVIAWEQRRSSRKADWYHTWSRGKSG